MCGRGRARPRRFAFGWSRFTAPSRCTKWKCHSEADAMEIFRSLLLLCAAWLSAFTFVGTKALAYTRILAKVGRSPRRTSLARNSAGTQGAGLFTPPTGITRTAKPIRTHWSVPEPGVVAIGQGRRQFEILTDGRIHNYHFCIYCARPRHARFAMGDAVQLSSNTIVSPASRSDP